MLQRRLPAAGPDDLSQPQFIYYEAASEPATALDLIEKEHLRLVRRLPVYAEAMRSARGSPQRDEARGIHAPFATLAGRIDHFQHELVHQQLGPSETERLTGLQSRLSLIVYVEDSLQTLMTISEPVPLDGRLASRISTLVEALDFMLLTLIDALESTDAEAGELLLQITEDRGDFVERIRQDYLAEESGASSGDRAVLLQVTSIFERVVWMTQRLARLIEAGRRAGSLKSRAVSKTTDPGLTPV